MAPSSCNLSLVISLLLLFSVTSGQQCDSFECKRHELSKLFEEALVNSGNALWQLQQIYFDPYSDHNPALVALSVNITVNDIGNDTWCRPNDDGTQCFCDTGVAFDNCKDIYDPHCKSGRWMFSSNHFLRLSDSESSYLTRLLTISLSTGVFFTIDPTFYSIIKPLSNSIELLPSDASAKKKHDRSTCALKYYTTWESMPG